LKCFYNESNRKVHNLINIKQIFIIIMTMPFRERRKTEMKPDRQSL